jgi:hypothetical protein
MADPIVVQMRTFAVNESHAEYGLLSGGKQSLKVCLQGPMQLPGGNFRFRVEI